MYICQKCNYSSESPANFCPLCGSAMTFHQPTYTNEATSKSTIVKKFVGMGLSIYGFVFAAIIALYDFIILLAVIGTGEDELALAAFLYTLILGLFSVPGSIIGLIFSNQVRNLGDNSAPSRVGKALGLAGLITVAVCFFLSIFSMLAGF